MPGAAPFGSEFLVNTTTANDQIEPTITALADGRFVVAWTDGSASGGDTSAAAVRAQAFNADGSKSGAEFLVNTTTTSSQVDPAITALADGRFVAAWQDFSQSGGDTSGVAVRAQAFNADGSTSGAEFLVNTTTANSQFAPVITALADGRFVVAWTDTSQSGGDTSAAAVRAQAFNADGSKAGAELLVNTATASDQFQPTVTALAGGRFVVAWTDDSQSGGDTSGFAVRAQAFNADGSKSGAELLVNTATASDQFQPTVTALAGGRFVVAWTDDSQSGGDTSGFAVRAQAFNADGSKSGAEFLVNTTTTNGQFQPTVTALAGGRFVVAWRDESQSGGDTSGGAVRAQVFDADGSKSGAEFLVNTTTANSQSIPTVTALADGRFVVAWTDNSQSGGDTSFTAVRGQIFDPREAGMNLSGTVLDDDFIGSGFGDVIDGQGGDDGIEGGGGNDVLRGGAGSDTLDGGDGNDVLDGGLGIDTLEGGVGDDTYIVDSTADIVIEAANGGFDTLRSSVSRSMAPNVERLILSATSGDINGVGRGGDDTIIGNGGDNRLRGGDGDDTLVAGNGVDRLYGDAGNDRLLAGAGNDVITGGLGRDVMTGHAGFDDFDFNSIAESGVTSATRDVITDFRVNVDDIDLRSIDANTGKAGNNVFTFIGEAAFSGNGGEVRIIDLGARVLVQADVDGGASDFESLVQGAGTLRASDFLL